MSDNPAMRIVTRFSTAVVLAFVVTVGAAAQTRGAHSFLWKVQSGSNVMYLAGSVHALTADAYPLNPAYQRAFDASSALVEEIDLAEADPLSGGLALLARGMYQDGRTFSSVVSRETATLVAEKLKNTPLALELIQPMKPWMVMLMLEALGAQSAGLDPELGLDKHFYNLATGAGKQVIGLETAEYQVDRFDKMPDTMQEQLLRSELAEMETEKTSLRARSEEHTSELQSLRHLVCRLLLETQRTTTLATLSLHDALPISLSSDSTSTSITWRRVPESRLSASRLPSTKSIASTKCPTRCKSSCSAANWRKWKRRKRACAPDRKSTRLNSSHLGISYAVFCLKLSAPPRSPHFPYTTLFRSP